MKLRALAFSTVLSVSLGLVACGQRATNLDFAVPEYHVLTKAPMLTEHVDQRSPYAGLRYIAFARILESGEYFDKVYIEKSNNLFQAYKYDDTDITDQYADWLTEIQSTLDAIEAASNLDTLFPYTSDDLYDGVSDDDPRKLHAGSLRKIAKVLLHDSARLWVAGDHTNSIKRTISTLNIAMQMRDPGYFDPLNPIIGTSIATNALEQYQWMLRDPSCTAEDREAIRLAMSMVEGDDPINLNRTTGLFVLTIDNWMQKQLMIEGGSDEFWYYFGMIHGATRLVEAMFKDPSSLDAALSNIEQIRQDLLDDLEDIDFKDIQEAYNRSHPIAVELGTSLIENTATESRISKLLERTEDDETGIADAMMLSFCKTTFRNTQQLKKIRSEVIRLAED